MCRSFLAIVVVSLGVQYSYQVVAQSAGPTPQSQIEIKKGRQSERADSISPTTSTDRTGNARKLYEHGLELMETDQLSQAAESFRQALQFDPEYADAYAALGRTYFKLREWQKAIDNLNRAAALNAKQRNASEEIINRRAAEKRQPDMPSGSSSSVNAASNSVKPNSGFIQAKTSAPAPVQPNKQDKPSNTQITSVQLSNAAATQTPPKVINSNSSNQIRPEIALAKQNSASIRNVTSQLPQATASPKQTQNVSPQLKNDAIAERGDTASMMNAPKEPAIQGVSNDAPATSKDEKLPIVEEAASGVRVSQPVNPAPPVNETSGTEVLSATRTEAASLTKIYRVGPNDVLDIRLNDTSGQESTLYTVNAVGVLEHPLLNEPMSVSGLTVEEIGSRIEADLRKRAIVENPKALVGVRDYASHTVLVSGLVKDAGTKFLRREAIPLYVVVADAQPLPEAAKVTVVRGDQNQIHEIDLNQVADMNFLVKSGDVITLSPHTTQFIYIGGEIKLPGEKTFRRGLTLMQAILASGGLGPKAKFAEIARGNENGFLVPTRYALKDIVSGKAVDPPLKPGDRISILR